MKNSPLIIAESLTVNSVSIRSFWDVIGDENYINVWPKDRKLPFANQTLVVIYTEKGQGVIRLKSGEKIEVIGNSLLFLDPQLIDSYCCDGYVWKLFWIEIFLNEGVSQSVPKNRLITVDNHRHFERQFDELLAVLGNSDPFSQNYAAALFNKMFFEWILMLNRERRSKSYEQVIAVIEEMHQRLSVNWQVKSMAQYAGCSEQHLRKLFIEHTKRSPKDYYLNLKLDISLSMLRRGGKSIAQVAFDLGFSDAFHFSNAFKKQFGYAPSAVEPLSREKSKLIVSTVTESSAS